MRVERTAVNDDVVRAQRSGGGAREPVHPLTPCRDTGIERPRTGHERRLRTEDGCRREREGSARSRVPLAT